MADLKKQLIGRVDKADFPDLSMENIAVKIDTGAYRSSIHCKNIREKDNVLSCSFLDSEHPSYNEKIFTFRDYKQVRVKSSNGIQQERFVIKTTIRLFGTDFIISLSLSDRSDMRFPVLIGRKFLSGKFIVDPESKDLSPQEENPSV